MVSINVANEIAVLASEIQNERFWLISAVAALYLFGLTMIMSFCSK